MALRFSPFLTSAILSCALVGPIVPHALSEPVPAGPAPLTIGRAVYPLNGPWKFQIGDSPIDQKTNAPLWAEPEFDDSNWESVDFTPRPGIVDPLLKRPGWYPGWTTRGHAGYKGWAWYRVRVLVSVEPGRQLAMAAPYEIEDACQIYANATLIGTFGRFRAPGQSPVFYNNLMPLMYPLPSGDFSSRPRPLTVAFRTWMGTDRLINFPAAGGLHYAPLLGDAEEIRSRNILDRYEDTLTLFGGPLESAAFLLLSIVAASLLLFDRSDPVYPWLAAVLLFSAVAGSVWLFSNYFPEVIDERGALFFWFAVYCPLHMGGWTLVWWKWFRFRRPTWVPWAIGAMTLLYLVVGITSQGFFLDATPIQAQGIFLLAPSVVRLVFLALLAFIVYQGIREHGIEGWIVVPAVLLMATMQFMLELARLHIPAFWKFGGVVFSTENLSNLILSAVVALLLLRRLLHTVQREKQQALDIKQAQEVQQVILPERRTMLPGMIVDCEFHPAREVGGDFFQVIPHPTDGSLLIVAGDVTGKGLQAGMLVALLVGAIRTLAPSDPDPLNILAALNQRLYGRRQAHATCLAVRIAPNGEATLANAGHLPPYINGEPVEVEGTLPLGIIEHPEFSVANFFLAENDRWCWCPTESLKPKTGRANSSGSNALRSC
jgi:hypothetical protein